MARVLAGAVSATLEAFCRLAAMSPLHHLDCTCKTRGDENAGSENAFHRECATLFAVEAAESQSITPCRDLNCPVGHRRRHHLRHEHGHPDELGSGSIAAGSVLPMSTVPRSVDLFAPAGGFACPAYTSLPNSLPCTQCGRSFVFCFPPTS